MYFGRGPLIFFFCLLIWKNVFKLIERNVYSSDDGFICQDISSILPFPLRNFLLSHKIFQKLLGWEPFLSFHPQIFFPYVFLPVYLLKALYNLIIYQINKTFCMPQTLSITFPHIQRNCKTNFNLTQHKATKLLNFKSK